MSPASQGISVQSVTKSFGGAPVLRELSLDFIPGELALLLGQNGSGKSTLLRLLARLLLPDSGSITSFPGKPDIVLGYTAHDPSLYGSLTVRENLEFFASLHRNSPSVTSIIEQWDLGPLEDRFPRTLSRGQLARCALARTFLGDPEIILLDEPTAFLDSHGVVLLERAVAGVSPASIIVIATHDLERTSHLARRAVVLGQGGIIHDSRSSSLEAAFRHYRSVNR